MGVYVHPVILLPEILICQINLFLVILINHNFFPMKQNYNTELKSNQKLELLVAIFNRQSTRPILDNFTIKQLIEAHGYLWDKLVEVHSVIQNREFVREEVTKKMMPSAAYQRQQGCDLRIDYCKGVECILSNPNCAGNKVKNHMEVMANKITEYLDSSADMIFYYPSLHTSNYVV